ncbi:hypothetical protein [Mycolicibacterium nivoides]|uniref:Uncharacterized protein n=1 Tax=Mycolicibacterium nivoides TaxID=2487344 RepID=A0ABW9LJ82_9MYCO
MINDSRLERTVAEGLMSLADVLIPEQGPWPAPSSTGLSDYFVEAVRVEQDQLELEILHTTWVNSPLEAPFEAARATERLIPSAFTLFRQICYTGYYAQPEVIRVLQSEMDCDYHSPPQPQGYLMDLEEAIVPPRVGHYTPTNHVRNVRLEPAS